MHESESGKPAQFVFAINEVEIGRIRHMCTVLAALVIAVVTLGAGTTPIIGKKILIRHIASNAIVREMDDFVIDISVSMEKDLNELSAGEFAIRWLPEMA